MKFGSAQRFPHRVLSVKTRYAAIRRAAGKLLSATRCTAVVDSVSTWRKKKKFKRRPIKEQREKRNGVSGNRERNQEINVRSSWLLWRIMSLHASQKKRRGVFAIMHAFKCSKLAVAVSPLNWLFMRKRCCPVSGRATSSD